MRDRNHWGSHPDFGQKGVLGKTRILYCGTDGGSNSGSAHFVLFWCFCMHKSTVNRSLSAD